MTKNFFSKAQYAVTLIEILIVLSIIAIFFAMSLPSVNNFFDRKKEAILQAQLLRAIQMTYQLADVEHFSVSLCPSKNHFTCSQNWLDGLLIFVDEEEDGIVHDQKQIFSVIQTDAQHGKLYFRSFPFYRRYLLFSSKEWIQSNNGTFWYCHQGESLPRWAIMINRSGRAKVVERDQEGMVRETTGKPLKCGATAI